MPPHHSFTRFLCYNQLTYRGNLEERDPDYIRIGKSLSMLVIGVTDPASFFRRRKYSDGRILPGIFVFFFPYIPPAERSLHIFAIFYFLLIVFRLDDSAVSHIYV